MSERRGYEVIRLRAQELQPGDVIHRPVDGGPPQWALVTGVYFQPGELIEVADDNLARYNRKESPNIGVANWIRSGANRDFAEYGKRLERVAAGLAVVVQTRLTVLEDNDANWVEFRRVALVDVQAHKS